VLVSYPDGYDPSAPYEIVLEADTDEDGVMERQSGTLIASTYDEDETVGVEGAPVPRESVRLSLAPNPFQSGSMIEFSLARPEAVELAIHDLSGRRVRMLQNGGLSAGPHRFEWNGRDDRGQRLPSGVYFVRYKTPARTLEAKVVKLQ
jgi:hypothetical protein